MGVGDALEGGLGTSHWALREDFWDRDSRYLACLVEGRDAAVGKGVGVKSSDGERNRGVRRWHHLGRGPGVCSVSY